MRTNSGTAQPGDRGDSGVDPQAWWLGRTGKTGRPYSLVADKSFLMPAKGDAFDFTVEAHCRWTENRRRWSAFCRRVDEFQEAVWDEIAQEVRNVLRGFPPDQATGAEEDLNIRLVELAAHQPTDTLRWEARVDITSHEDVRAAQRQAWQENFKEAARHQHARRVVTNHTDLIDRWRKLLEHVGIGDLGDPPAPYLGRYLIELAARPEDAAKIVEALARAREAKDEELLKTVKDAMGGSGFGDLNVNLLAIHDTHESALKRLMDWAGLRGPDDPPTWNGTTQ